MSKCNEILFSFCCVLNLMVDKTIKLELTNYKQPTAIEFYQLLTTGPCECSCQLEEFLQNERERMRQGLNLI